MSEPRVVIWRQAPEPAIPQGPAVLADARDVWLAYETTAEPIGSVHAVVRFGGAIGHRLSPVNDEGLAQHPYAAAGLRPYSFQEIIDSPEAARWRALGTRHWVVTFKDSTLDVLARTAEIIVAAERAEDATDALLAVVRATRGKG